MPAYIGAFIGIWYRLGYCVFNRQDEKLMRINRLQVVLVSMALLTSAILAEVLAPRELMARTAALDLEAAIPRQFGAWNLAPTIQPINPPDQERVVDPHAKHGQIYSQAASATYAGRSGNHV